MIEVDYFEPFLQFLDKVLLLDLSTAGELIMDDALQVKH
jgi:hypothetical protein